MHILQKAIIGTVSGALAGGLTSFGSTLYFRKEDKKEREIEKQEDKKFQNITKNEYLRRLKKELNSRNKLDEETSLFEDIQVIMKCPKRLFIKALFRVLFSIKNNKPINELALHVDTLFTVINPFSHISRIKYKQPIK